MKDLANFLRLFIFIPLMGFFVISYCYPTIPVWATEATPAIVMGCYLISRFTGDCVEQLCVYRGANGKIHFHPKVNQKKLRELEIEVGLVDLEPKVNLYPQYIATQQKCDEEWRKWYQVNKIPTGRCNVAIGYNALRQPNYIKDESTVANYR